MVGYATSTTIGSSQGQQSVLEGIELINANNSGYSFATIDNSAQVGGIVGRGNNVNISNFKLDNIVVINGSTDGQDDINTTTGAGGVAGNLEGLENNISNITISNSFISALTKAGGVTGTFAGGNISNITTENSVNIYSGTSGSARGNQKDYQISLNSDNIPLAGGIVAQMKAGTISQSTNNANVVSGYNEQQIIDDTGYTSYQLPDYYSTQGKPLVQWESGDNVLIKPTQNQNFGASKESYAGGIAGKSEHGVKIEDCTNNGNITANAEQEMYTKCIFHVGLGYVAGIPTYGEHKFYYTIIKELAYSNGITFITPYYDVTINSCHNSGQILGGAEVGGIWVYNTADWWDFGSQFFQEAKFYMLNYGYYIDGSLFNSYYYLYGRNEERRNELMLYLINSECHGLLGVKYTNPVNATGGYITNLYYTNQICNNPTVIKGSIYSGNNTYNYYSSSSQYNFVTNCTMSSYAIVGQCTNGKGFFDVLLSDPNHVPNNSSFPLDIVAPPMFDYYYLTPYNHQNDEGMGISYA